MVDQHTGLWAEYDGLSAEKYNLNVRVPYAYMLHSHFWIKKYRIVSHVSMSIVSKIINCLLEWNEHQSRINYCLILGAENITYNLCIEGPKCFNLFIRQMQHFLSFCAAVITLIYVPTSTPLNFNWNISELHISMHFQALAEMSSQMMSIKLRLLAIFHHILRCYCHFKLLFGHSCTILHWC